MRIFMVESGRMVTRTMSWKLWRSPMYISLKQYGRMVVEQRSLSGIPPFLPTESGSVGYSLESPGPTVF